MGATIEQEREIARRIEELGYGSIWTGEIVGGKEAFAHQSVLLAATEHISTGTGIANVWARQPAAMEGGGATLGAAYPGRFVLGIGISHGPIVEMSGQVYAKPLETMIDYLDGMDASVAFAPAAAVPVPRVLAALRPKMLELARTRADGAHPYFVPPDTHDAGPRRPGSRQAPDPRAGHRPGERPRRSPPHWPRASVGLPAPAELREQLEASRLRRRPGRRRQ